MNLRNIDLNLLVVLEAILSEQGVSQAARRMHLSQSALSHGLARLRDLLDDALLVRVGQRMELTPRAQALLPEVRRVLSQIGELIRADQRFDPRLIDRIVHVGASDWVAQGLLSRLAAALGDEAPCLRLHVHHSGRVDAPDLLRAGKLDLALGVFPAPTAGIEIRTLLEDPYTCARSTPVPSHRPPTLEDYLAATHVNVLVQGDTLGGVDAVLSRSGLKRDIRVTVAHFYAALSVAGQTRHWFTGPRGLIQAHARRLGLHTFEPPVSLPPMGIQMAWSSRTQGDACLDWLRLRLTEIGRGES